jgi:hypothetical protein
MMHFSSSGDTTTSLLFYQSKYYMIKSSTRSSESHFKSFLAMRAAKSLVFRSMALAAVTLFVKSISYSFRREF